MKRIEFSGCDGSGKTTALLNTVDFLKKRGYRVLHSREVGNPHINTCVKLRSLALDPNSNLNGKSMELICAAMRIENELFYEKVKNDYDFILSDRGYLDHLAYGDVNCNPEFTTELFVDCIAKYTTKPNLIFYFDVKMEEAKRRRVVRNEVIDAIELKGDEFQSKVIERFKTHINCESIVHEIDANQSQTDVFQQIVDYFIKNVF
jgi:dTMP kinase